MPAPVITREETIRDYRRHVNSGMARVLELAGSPMEASACGNYVTDHTGRTYLDCGGYCVFLLGHGHPEIVAAVSAQLHRRALGTRSLVDPLLAQACAAIARSAPPGLSFVWMGNSGTEAVEAALKIARLNGCEGFVAMDGGFHGKTLGSLSVSGRKRFREPFEPLLPGVRRVPFGDSAELARAIGGGGRRQAVIVEPIQGEAGVIVPPAGYLSEVRAQCDRAGAILIVDEISTGLGRTGHMWCCERENVVPDVLLTGKALGGGVVPASAVVTTEELFAGLNRDPLLHTSTFAGNPLAATAAVATLDVLRELDAPRRAAELGAELLAAVGAIAAETGAGLVEAVRGAGLLIGIELSHEHLAAELLIELMERGVIVSHSMFAHGVVRLTPPVTLEDEDLDLLYGALRESLVAVAERYPELAGQRAGVTA